MQQDLQTNNHTTSNTKDQETKIPMVLTTKTHMAKTTNMGLITMGDSLAMELKVETDMQINSTNYSKCPWSKATHSKLQ